MSSFEQGKETSNSVKSQKCVDYLNDYTVSASEHGKSSKELLVLIFAIQFIQICCDAT